ncbi:MAG: UDP-N-acetylglucosamine 2-epimerase (non-hydrolyzing) [Anaerolineales bacterium]|nr:UDP-N-acetylglucosamine 2-epimerase (non-hydrolyzing) [Anaerolineales bacterium]
MALKIMHVVGARPNFMKIAPILAAMRERGEAFQQTLVHTGQHYDDEMSRIFFDDLGMPAPDAFLGVGSGTHAQQTARVMEAFEPLVLKLQPDWVMVVGDVNSTLACSLVCAKLGVRVAHVEAGLRSWDRGMPEEINRLLTDQISDLLFTPSQGADANLLREGIDARKIHFVGNVMIDTLVSMLPRARARPILQELGLAKGEYVLVTLHRPSNVDQPQTLAEILSALQAIGQEQPVIFPVHPRTRKNMQAFGLGAEGVRFLEPLGYLDFLALTDSAGLVLTDSGGIQEETTYLDVPCLTARPSTERPVTVEMGTNRLVASKQEAILAAIQAVRRGEWGRGKCPPLWDGQTAGRIAEVMLAQGG